MEKRKVIIDCDPGIDDSLAILLAINSPELEVLGLTITSVPDKPTRDFITKYSADEKSDDRRGDDSDHAVKRTAERAEQKNSRAHRDKSRNRQNNDLQKLNSDKNNHGIRAEARNVFPERFDRSDFIPEARYFDNVKHGKSNRHKNKRQKSYFIDKIPINQLTNNRNYGNAADNDNHQYFGKSFMFV